MRMRSRAGGALPGYYGGQRRETADARYSDPFLDRRAHRSQSEKRVGRGHRPETRVTLLIQDAVSPYGYRTTQKRRIKEYDTVMRPGLRYYKIVILIEI